MNGNRTKKKDLDKMDGLRGELNKKTRASVNVKLNVISDRGWWRKMLTRLKG